MLYMFFLCSCYSPIYFLLNEGLFVQFEQILVTQEQIYQMRSFWDRIRSSHGHLHTLCIDRTKEVIKCFSLKFTSLEHNPTTSTEQKEFLLLPSILWNEKYSGSLKIVWDIFSASKLSELPQKHCNYKLSPIFNLTTTHTKNRNSH